MDKSKVYKRKDENGNEQNAFSHNKVFNLKINTKWIDPDYSLIFADCNYMSENRK